MESNKKPLDVNCWRGLLMKEKKLVCDIQSKSVPLTLPPNLVILRYESASIFPLSVLPKFELCPLGANPLRLVEWQHFLTYLSKRNKVAVLGIDGWELFINPPSSKVIDPKQSVIVSYRQKVPLQPTSFVPLQPTHNLNTATGFKQQSQPVGFMLLSLEKKEHKTKDESPKFARTHPSYMETLGQTHACWIFGAIAELVDNARDAGATRLDISIEQEYFKAKNIFIPVLCVIDNGIGMSHTDIMRMVSFGHKRPEEDDEDLIGRFGVGFKTGAMRLGKDVVVFTQSKETRSIAFFSRSFNEGKEVVEIPLITYKKNQGWMDFDSDVHSQEQAALSLKAVKDCSPFNEYSIGAKFEAFGEGTGTLVCIYNLDRWGSEHTLSWDLKSAADLVSKSKHDITIRSRRVRTRPAQMSREVPLDYSLHAYLEVMFLEPKMKIFVQGTPVKTRRLHKSLNKTKIFRDTLVGKKVELTLGCSQEERDRGNCGIFLYWHGRLIEAYKRVGGMAHTADMGRGVIGVVDVTDIMRLGNGNVAVLNNKQGFLDCEVYAVLEDWLGKMANSYWDENFDCLEVGQKDENAEYNPDHSWVQCNKCLKWRILDRSFNTKELSTEWFCFMPPFKGTCAMVQQEVEAGVVTIGATRDCGSMGYQSRRVKEEVDQSTTATNSIVSNTECSDASVEDLFNSKPKESKGTLRRLKRESSAKDHPPGSRKTCKSS